MSMVNTVCILTPSFNRAYTLEKLYKSLCDQSCSDFEWLIIDDGSTDNTEIVVNQFIKENRINLKYHKKVNGGKHTALNYSYRFIESPLTFIVDSDDSLDSRAVEVILGKYNEFKHLTNICGYSFLRGRYGGGILSYSGVPYDGIIETYVECRINRKIGGDMAEVWYTKCLKEYMFPEYSDEKFLSEDIVWVEMSKKYKMIFFNDIIYYSNYLDDGLTKNRRKHNISSPRGCVKRASVFLESNAKFSVKFINMLQYQIYSLYAKVKAKVSFKNTSKKILFIICFVPARLIFYKWNKKRGSNI